jgi:hypothetical protein
VLTAEDLRTRVGRLGRELGVVTESVTVHGQCLSDCAPSSTPGKCVAMFGEREGGKPFAALLDQQAELEPGRRYVLQGSVELSPAVRDRWLLRAEVLAVVVPE